MLDDVPRPALRRQERRSCEWRLCGFRRMRCHAASGAGAIRIHIRGLEKCRGRTGDSRNRSDRDRKPYARRRLEAQSRNGRARQGDVRCRWWAGEGEVPHRQHRTAVRPHREPLSRNRARQVHGLQRDISRASGQRLRLRCRRALVQLLGARDEVRRTGRDLHLRDRCCIVRQDGREPMVQPRSDG